MNLPDARKGEAARMTARRHDADSEEVADLLFLS